MPIIFLGKFVKQLFPYYSGQLVVASLLQKNVKSRLILRDPEKAKELFGEQDKEKLQVHHLLFIE